MWVDAESDAVSMWTLVVIYVDMETAAHICSLDVHCSGCASALASQSVVARSDCVITTINAVSSFKQVVSVLVCCLVYCHVAFVMYNSLQCIL